MNKRYDLYVFTKTLSHSILKIMILGKGIKEGIKKWFQDNPYPKAIVSGSLHAIPYLGPVLGKIFDQSTQSEDVKTKQILEILENLEKLSDERLEYLTDQLDKSMNIISKNSDYLMQLSEFIPTMTTKFQELQTDIQKGTINVQIDIAHLHLEIFKVRDGIITKMDEVKQIVDAIPKKIIQPQIRSALHMGEAFAMTGQKKYAGIIYAKSLDVEDFFENSTVNEIHQIVDALKAKYGSIISESFLLGRQLAILCASSPDEVNSETKGLLLSRLQLVLDDKDIINGVEKFWTQWVEHKFGDRPMPSFFIILLQLLYKEKIDLTDPSLQFINNAYKAKSADELQTQMPKDEERSTALKSMLTRLKAHGINDPNVDVFLAVMTGDKELLQKAIDSGADLTITDTRVIDSYRNLLLEISSTELAIFEK
jgi:hypothetical protein